ncbi:TPA: hypothetical protein DCX16_02420 [bacterium]|nr:hypothetical protein [bacterium]
MNKRDIFLVLMISLFLAIFLSPFASPWPDGLEKVAEKLGFLEKGEGKFPFNAPIPEYLFPGIKSERLATSVAGFVGTLFIFFLSYCVAWLLKRR